MKNPVVWVTGSWFLGHIEIQFQLLYIFGVAVFTGSNIYVARSCYPTGNNRPMAAKSGNTLGLN